MILHVFSSWVCDLLDILKKKGILVKLIKCVDLHCSLYLLVK